MKQIIKSCLKSVIASCKRYEVDFDALLVECIKTDTKNLCSCQKPEVYDPFCPVHGTNKL